MKHHAVFFVLLLSALQAAEPRGRDPNDVLLDKDLCAVTLKTQAGGPKITAEDLAGRTVLFIFAGPSDAKWNEFMVRMGNQYINAAPPGGLVTIFVPPGDKADCKWWTAGGGNPAVSFFTVDNFSMPGFGYTGGPRYILFDADGRMLGDICHDGRDLSGNSVHTYGGSRFTAETIRKSVEASGAVIKGAPGKAVAIDATKLVEGALTAAPITPVLSALRTKAKEGKEGAKDAAALLDGFKEYLVRQHAVVERNLATNPVFSMRIIKRIQAQLAGDKELSAPFEKLQERLKADKAFQEELKAGEQLCAIRTQAAWIKWGLLDPDLPQRPKDQVQAIKKGLEEIITKFPRSRAALSAAELKDAFTYWAAKAIDPTPW